MISLLVFFLTILGGNIAMSASYTFMKESPAAGSTVQVRFTDKPCYTNSQIDSSARFVIGYWSIRGLGAPLRMMLCAAKVDHDVFLYDLVENGEAWGSEYFAEKAKLVGDHPLMNLPFVVDREEEHLVCQTNACFSFLGEKCNMMGKNSREASQCMELLCEIYDLRNLMVKFAYGTGNGTDEDAKATVKGGKKHLSKLNSWLDVQADRDSEKTASFLVGNAMSAPDFHLFEMLDQYQGLCTKFEIDDCLSEFPRLKVFLTNFAKLEENQLYLNSWLHNELPFNNCLARFASLPELKTYKHGHTDTATWRGKGKVDLVGTKN